jgi:hypothetical protein
MIKRHRSARRNEIAAQRRNNSAAASANAERIMNMRERGAEIAKAGLFAKSREMLKRVSGRGVSAQKLWASKRMSRARPCHLEGVASRNQSACILEMA